MRAPDPKFLSLLFLAFVTLPPTSLSIDPESIIPPHVRHETSTLIKNNLSDPLLDYTYFPRKQLVHDNTILEVRSNLEDKPPVFIRVLTF